VEKEVELGFFLRGRQFEAEAEFLLQGGGELFDAGRLSLVEIPPGLEKQDVRPGERPFLSLNLFGLRDQVLPNAINRLMVVHGASSSARWFLSGFPVSEDRDRGGMVAPERGGVRGCSLRALLLGEIR